MKKLVLATAVAALTATSAQAAPKVYGQANLYMNFDQLLADNAPDGKATMEDGSSRIGFKGGEKLSDGSTKAIYKLEYGLNLDAPGKDFGLKPRDSYLGLASDQFGTLKFGRISSPDDIAYSTMGNIKYDGLVYTSSTKHDGDRYNNAMMYSIPEVQGFNASVFYAMDEEPNKGDVLTVAAEYDAGMVKLGGAIVNQFADKGDDVQTYRLSAGTSMSGVDLGITYATADKGLDDETHAIQLGAATTMGKTTVFGQFDTAITGDDQDFTVSGGLSQKLGKRTKGLVEIGLTNPEGDDNNVLGLAAGIKHKF